MHLAPGSYLGPYEISAFLGSGGMGEVYKAQDPRLGRFVALKILHVRNLPDVDQRRAWSADGRDVIFSTGETALAGMYRMPADGSAAPVRIDAAGEGVVEPALSWSAHRLSFSRTFRSVTIWRLDRHSLSGRAEQFIASSSFRDAFPQYSPDGKRIVFSNCTGLNQIWTCFRNGSNPSQLTSLPGTTTGTPRWSPDGHWISFDSNSGGHWQVYVISATGGKPRPITSGEYGNVVASWSRDGRWIYFTSKMSGSEEVWKKAFASDAVVDPGGPAVHVTHHGGTSSLESPDGTFLYLTKTNARLSSVFGGCLCGGGSETEFYIRSNATTSQ